MFRRREPEGGSPKFARGLAALFKLSIQVLSGIIGGNIFSARRQMRARLYKPAKTAMQSGQAKTKEWVLEFEPAAPPEVDPLMGWTGSSDTLSQVCLYFDTKEEAVHYAETNGIPYRVFDPHPHSLVKKSYADNFKYGRVGSWTH
jgi:hypothetical protein